MTDLAVRTVRIHGTVPGPSPRAAAEALLQAMAPTGDDHGVLIVRRLRLDGFRGDDARGHLAEVRRRAARPALGANGAPWAAPEAEAVWFRDEAEALACLTADLIAGCAASRWYWRSRLSTTPYGTSRLAQVWLRDVCWLPAALRLLESGMRGASARAAGALTTPEAALVLATLLPGPVVRGPAPVQPVPPRFDAGSGEQLGKPGPSPLPSPPTAARWARLLPPGVMSLPPGQRELLAVAMVLSAEPAAPAGELRAWARAVDVLAAGPAGADDEGQVAAAQALASSRDPDRPSVAAGDGQPRPEIVVDHALQHPDGEAPGSELVEAIRPGAAGTAEPGLTPASLGTERIEPPRDHVRPPLPDGEPEPPAYGLLDPWPDAVWSGHATACYLLNLLLRCEEEPSWADLVRFARRVLRGRPGVRRRARDPLWRVLRGLSGADRIPGAPVPAWWPPALGYLTAHRVGPEVFAQPGRIAVTRTHVDVVLDLEQTDLAVRISGLDQNPGWVRSLGRIVSFHFDDAPRSRP